METLSDLIFHIRDRSAGRPELLSIDRGGRRETLSTAEFLSGIHTLALGLEKHGLRKGDRVAILAENRPEWHVVDFACQLLGAVSVPIYATSTAEQVGFILRNSGARFVFYSDKKKRELLESLEVSLTQMPRLVSLDEDAVSRNGTSLVLLQGDGAVDANSRPLDSFRGRLDGHDMASIIYTSGTTGDPKGVVLTHRNFVSNFLACDSLFPLGPSDLALSFLPLSHVFERTVDHLFFYRGVALHYSPSIERVPQLLPKVRPTVLSSVPRVYERAYLKITQQMTKEPVRSQKIFAWALRIGRKYASRRESFIGPWLWLERRIADRLVYSKIKDRFGGRLRMAIAGGAPLSDEVAEFFDAVDIDLFQGYGMTECSPVIAANHPSANRLGTVGRPLPGVEVEIARDGEILVRSAGVMQGYWENPTATSETIDGSGWLHTGDIGELDEDGFLRITDRKKDLIVTSGGKNIAPQPIESLLTSHWAISQALVVGDNYPHVTALLVPRFEEMPSSLRGLSPIEAIGHSDVLEITKAAVREVNARLPEHERVRKWTLLPGEFTEEAGELTPTLKIRRKVVLQKYSDKVDAMYLKTQKSQQITIPRE